MSSPKSVGRKTVRAAQPRALPEQSAGRTSADARDVAAAIERGIADGRLDVVSADALQALMAAATRLYAARREAGEEFTPVARNTISATDVMVTASGLLKGADLAVFELGMWQSWTGR